MVKYVGLLFSVSAVSHMIVSLNPKLDSMLYYVLICGLLAVHILSLRYNYVTFAFCGAVAGSFFTGAHLVLVSVIQSFHMHGILLLLLLQCLFHAFVTGIAPFYM